MKLRNAASLILINSVKNSFEKAFNLLLLKRINTTKSFANKIVFPGGVLDKSDFDHKWMGIIDQKLSSTQLKNIICENELSLYKDSKPLSSVMPQIFYRICAIRETFEETGILLAFDESRNHVLTNEKIIEDIKLNNWQKKVSENGSLFIELFKSYQLTPDLLSLYEWSEWMPPYYFKPRFHTAFFMTFIDHELKTNINTDESSSLIWKTPKEAHGEFSKTKELAPPQIAELFDLSCFSTLDKIKNQAMERQKIGGFRNLQYVINLSDGCVHLLPGDSKYKISDCEFTDALDLSIEDFGETQNVRRFIVKNKDFSYKSNIYSMQ